MGSKTQSKTNSSTMQKIDPTRLVVWAGIEGVIENAQMSGLIQLGRTSAKALPGQGMREMLLALELGEENREEFGRQDANGVVVRLRRDVFEGLDACALPWSRKTLDLVRRYNEEMPTGGGAVHPLHIVHHEIHRKLGGIVDIAARNAATGEIVVSRPALKQLGITESDAVELLGDGAMVYFIKP